MRSKRLWCLHQWTHVCLAKSSLIHNRKTWLLFSRKTQLDRARTSSARKMDMTFRCKKLLPLNSIIPLYKFCIRTITEYGCPLHIGAPKTLLALFKDPQSLQKIPNRVYSVNPHDSFQSVSGRLDLILFFHDILPNQFFFFSCILSSIILLFVQQNIELMLSSNMCFGIRNF